MGIIDSLFGTEQSLKVEDLDVTYKRFSALLPYKSADFQADARDTHIATELYYLKDNSVLKVYECVPMVLANEDSFDQLARIIETRFAQNTIIQVSLLADDCIDKIIEGYKELRREAGGMFIEQANRLTEHYKRALSGLEQMSGCPVRNFRLIVSVKIPMKAKPYDSGWDGELTLNIDMLRDVQSTLRSMGLNPKVMAPDEFITFLVSILNPGVERRDMGWDIAQTIDRQILYADTPIDIGDTYIKFGNVHAACLTPKRYPRDVDYFTANSLIGQISGGKSFEDDSKQIRCKFLYTLNIVKTDLKGLIARKGKQVSVQETPKDGATAPAVNARKAEFGWAFNQLEAGEEFCRIIPILWLFNEDKEKLDILVSDVKSIWYREVKLETQLEQDYILPKMLVSSLPGGLYGKDILQLQRDWIVTTKGAARFAPLAGGYRGNGEPYMLYIDRRGQLTSFDLFHTAANRNILITGGTGGGKSFLMNYIVSSYLSCGHRIRILDVGGSYEKLAYLVDGTYIYPIQDQIKINFFESLSLPTLDFDNLEAINSPVSVNGTLAMLTSIIATMVYSRTAEKATEQERVLIETAIKECYAKKKNETTVDDICTFLNNIYQYYKERENGSTAEYINMKYEKSIQSAHFMSEALIKYTSKGEYGQFFTGKTNVNLEKQLVVTELNNLPDDLKKVLVLAMTSIISDEIYKGDNTPSLIFLDEAWQTLSENPAAAEFVEGLYRKVRKHNGGVGIITQSVSDLDSEHGKLKHLGTVLRAQSAYHFIILDLEFHKAISGGSFEVSDFELKYYYDRMPDPRSIQYRYSEIFIKGPTISAVVRLLVDQYTYMVNTSSADEKDYIIYLTEKHMRTGKSKGESLRLAIDECDKLATKLGSIGTFSSFVRKEATKIREGLI